MPKFHVLDTFSWKNQNKVVLIGNVTEGVIDAGMIVHMPFNSSLSMTAPIDSIEYVDRVGEKKESFLGLCIKIEDAEAANDDFEHDLWWALSVSNEEILITAPD